MKLSASLKELQRASNDFYLGDLIEQAIKLETEVEMLHVALSRQPTINVYYDMPPRDPMDDYVPSNPIKDL